MRRLCITFALLLGACANAGIEPAGLESPIQTGSVAPPADANEAARGELRKVQHKAVEESRRPVRVFLAEKSTDCTSPRLKEAVHKVTETAAAVAATMKPEYASMLQAGAAVLDVADEEEGLRAKCPRALRVRAQEFCRPGLCRAARAGNGRHPGDQEQETAGRPGSRRIDRGRGRLRLPNLREWAKAYQSPDAGA